MKNLDQIRANNALRHKDRIANSQGGGDAISGFPMLVLTDGLLAALAFACEWKDRRSGTRKHPGEYTVAHAMTEHLGHERNTICIATDPDDLLHLLASSDTDTLLRRATAESLAFLSYLKRFVA
jgi:CRISPR/Cas system CMR-associated protein Cmr5 small subunit